MALRAVRQRLLRVAVRGAHGHSHGGVACSHSHGPDPPAESGTLEGGEEDDCNDGVVPPPAPLPEDSGLPLEQRAKNVLVSALRAQLSTISRKLGDSKQPHRPAVHGSLAPFALLPDGVPVVFLDEEDAHVANAAANPMASVTVGGTDPPSLVALLRTEDGRTALPRVSMLGQLARVSPGEAEYARRRAVLAHKAAGGEAPLAASLAPFRLDVQDMRWVDVRGGMHEVGTERMVAAFADPFSFGSSALLSRLNGSDARRTHVMLCRAFMGVELQEAVLIGVDRSGITMLGRAAPDQPWREFRFAFQTEVRDEKALLSTLADMAGEAEAHLSGGDGKEAATAS